MTTPESSNKARNLQLRTSPNVVAWWSAVVVMLALSVLPALVPSRTFTSSLVSSSAAHMVYAPDQMFAQDGSPPESAYWAPWSEAIPTTIGDRLVVRTSVARLPLPERGHRWLEVEADEHLSLFRVTNADENGTGQSGEIESDEPVFGMGEALQEVWVERTSGSPMRCERAFGRFRCGPADWNYVGETTQTIEGREQACLWVHPHSEGPLVLTFAVPPGYAGLNASFALSDIAADEARDTSIRVVVTEAADTGDSVEMAVPFERGWQDAVLRLAPDSNHLVRVAISAVDPGMAHLCARVTATPARPIALDSPRRVERRARSEFEAEVRGRLSWLGLNAVQWMRPIRNLTRAVTLPPTTEGAP
jgi:hypothetical protein